MVADMGDRVHQYVRGLGPHLAKDCLTASLQDGMTIARIQAHAQNLEEQYQQRRGERDSDRGSRKRGRSFGAGSEYRGGQASQHSRYPEPDQSARASGSQHRAQSNRTGPPPPRCTRCGKLHSGQCYLDTGACFVCGQTDHLMRDCPRRTGRDQTQPAGSAIGSSSTVRPPGQTSQAPAGRGRGRGGAPSTGGSQNRIFALTRPQDPEPSQDAATGTLSAFLIKSTYVIDLHSIPLCVILYIVGENPEILDEK
ncbi:DEAD-box ATP-dependent RNA helicase 3A, chloroplastic-like [Lycium ferocissimum]|uniref:DEAD-box ATP-dependent RNA helicase 3A, chloroplastic-like n=1 Tax=Lycium ferocissimum TaxID=112874 RepID=UPI0028161336|nr:DEAD-box ATP-dependent RNA helicase 3A, chloroplastic-like [Lycium ferocissimum]